MLVTSEASQRNGLVTFTLEPQRSRMVLAKFLAGVALGARGDGAGLRAGRARHPVRHRHRRRRRRGPSTATWCSTRFVPVQRDRHLHRLRHLAMLIMNTAGAIVAYFAYTPDPADRGRHPQRAQRHVREDRALDRVQHRPGAADSSGDYTPTGEEWAQIAVSGTSGWSSRWRSASGGCCASSSSRRSGVPAARPLRDQPGAVHPAGPGRAAQGPRHPGRLLAARGHRRARGAWCSRHRADHHAGPAPTRCCSATSSAIAAYMMSFLLPFLAIMLVTSEWSQRSALVTFALEPRAVARRAGQDGGRAAADASSTWSPRSSSGWSARRSASWSSRSRPRGTSARRQLAGFFVTQSLAMLGGFAIATLLINTPASIVLFVVYRFVLPGSSPRSPP